MISHSQQQDEATRLANHMMATANPGTMPNPNHMNDLNYKFQQVQNQQVCLTFYIYPFDNFFKARKGEYLFLPKHILMINLMSE